MGRRPGISDESVLSRWMSLEMGRINEGIVAVKKPLATLLREETPSSVTRGGKEHRFQIRGLRQLGEGLPEALQHRLLLPILFHFDPDVEDSFLLTDPAAVEALQALGEIGPLRQLREGKLWVGKAIVYALIRKYPTLVQIAMG